MTPSESGPAGPRQESWVPGKEVEAPEVPQDDAATAGSLMSAARMARMTSSPATPSLSVHTQADTIGESQPAKRSSGVVPIVVGVGVLCAGCLALSLYWSRWERTRLVASPESQLEASGTNRQEGRSPLQQVLDRSLPMIEEQAILGSDATLLHGEAVGHRLMKVDDPHASLAGPHFSRKRQSSVNAPGGPSTQSSHQSTDSRPAGERLLRRSIRDALRTAREPMSPAPLPDPEVTSNDDRPSTSAVEVAPSLGPGHESSSHSTHTAEMANDARANYDVVQPEPMVTDLRKPGALERALRSYAQGQLG